MKRSMLTFFLIAGTFCLDVAAQQVGEPCSVDGKGGVYVRENGRDVTCYAAMDR